MTAPEPVAEPLGTRRPAAGARREYLLTLLAGALGAVVVLLAARQDWARVVTLEPHPLPASRVAVSGQDLVPAAGALGLAALAGLAAVLATRGLVRRIVGGLLAVFGVAIIASVSLPVTAAQVRSAAVGATTSAQAGSVPGGSTVGSGTTPGTGGSGVAGLSLASHVEMAAFPWRWAVLVGGLLVLGAGVLVAWRGTRWAVMSSRYDRPASRKPAAAADPGSLWESLSQGLDPTELTDPVDPAGLTDTTGPGAPAAGSGTAPPGSGAASGSNGTGRGGAG
ncbi:MAG: Trp biosynthesis-associated membrane protein [Streptosporangiaceae bacterium]